LSTLLVVRHAQASFRSDDYDRLSELGQRQARVLADHWTERRVRPDAVWVGPRLRHRQTCDAVAAAYREHGLHWPEPRRLDDLDEHHGQQILRAMLPRLVEADPATADLVRRHRAGEPEAARDYLRLYHRVLHRWIRGEPGPADPDGGDTGGAEAGEPWTDFRQRVRRAVEVVTADAGSGRTVAAFTSGGVMAAVAGLALGIDDARILELSWVTRNASYSEFLFSRDRFSLVSFNVVPALDAAEQSFI
jgi:broad specificity phosphatase PhoE